MSASHIPVLLPETLAALDLRPGLTVVDGTLGLGGHAVEMLRRVTPNGRLIGIDFDATGLERARTRLAETGGRFDLRQGNFANLPGILVELGLAAVDRVLLDLGVSSPQLDDAARGFSYRKPGPLDMRMDPSRGRSAAELLRSISATDLAAALRDLGDEEDAEAIAALIVERRESMPIETTLDLAQIVCTIRNFTLERASGAKLHPAARTFQALRMLVNRELTNLERLLHVAPTLLAPGGILAVISFHSGEDRAVKHALRDGQRSGIYQDVSADAILAGDAEREENPRARSAKLRWARRAGAGSAPVAG